MNRKEVLIAISSIQNYGEEETDNIDFSTDGFYDFGDGTARLTYFETEVTGLSGTKTVVLIQADEIIVDRVGQLTSHMVFREGEKLGFVYDTPYGKANMTIRANRIEHSFDEYGGQMVIDYVMDMEHVAAIRTRFSLTVTEIDYSKAGLHD